MFVRAEIVQAVAHDAILAPQQAVSRDEKGNPQAYVVGAGDKLEVRPLTTSRAIGNAWLVTSGLKPGDRLVMDGAMMLQPGTPVKPVAWTPAPPPSKVAEAAGK
jgi:membrane fusion protein (multidrug efflux system)